MDENNQELVPKPKNNPSRQELQKQRVDELLDSCKDEVIKQIIGPFGLSQAMFDDKDGGNITTRHNFEQGITATEKDAERYEQYQNSLEDFDRKDYDKDLPGKRKKMFQNDEPIISSYTGNELTRDGQTHLDHVRAAENIERDASANLFKTKEERVEMANSPDNLVPCESGINQSMGKKDKQDWAKSERKKDPGKTNAESFGVDTQLLDETTKKSDRHIKVEMLKAQVKKQGKELLQTGAEEAARNALRQAMGLVLYEFVNGSFKEVKRIANDPTLKENFVDHLIEAMRNIIEKIKDKAEHILKSVLSGGVQGFISNLLTFIINNIVTTAAKVVTIIREGLKGLWEAVKLIMNPPEGMSGIDVARQASKIIATVITTSLGIILEKSIEAFILSIPILAPLAPFISPVITGLLTGIVTALVIFAIDKLFDWLTESGTEVLNAQIEYMEANVALFEHMAQMVESQFNNSKQYQICIAEYNQIEVALSESNTHLNNAVFHAEYAVSVRATTLLTMKEGLSNFKSLDDELDSLLLAYEQN